MKYHCLKNIFKKRRKYSLVHKHNIGQPTFSTFLKRAFPPQNSPWFTFFANSNTSTRAWFLFLTSKKSNFLENRVSFYRKKIKRQTHQWSHSVLFPSKQKGRTSLCVSVNVKRSQPGRPVGTPTPTSASSSVGPTGPSHQAKGPSMTSELVPSCMHICLFFCFVFLEIIIFFFFVRRNRYRKKRETELDTCVSSTYCRAACMLHAVVQFARTWILKRYNQETEAIPIAQKTLWTQLCSLFHVPQFGAECLSNSIPRLHWCLSSTLWKMYCTVQSYWADLKAPLTVTPHHRIPPRGLR